MITATGSPVTADCCSSSATRRSSARRLSMPVSWSRTTSSRCSRSERISAVERIPTAIEQRHRGDQLRADSRMTPLGVAEQGRSDHADEGDADSGGEAVEREARRQGDHGEHEPRQQHRLLGDHDRRRDHQLGADESGEEGVLGAVGLGAHARGERKHGGGREQRQDRPPAKPGTLCDRGDARGCRSRACERGRGGDPCRACAGARSRSRTATLPRWSRTGAPGSICIALSLTWATSSRSSSARDPVTLES